MSWTKLPQIGQTTGGLQGQCAISHQAPLRSSSSAPTKAGRDDPAPTPNAICPAAGQHLRRRWLLVRNCPRVIEDAGQCKRDLSTRLKPVPHLAVQVCDGTCLVEPLVIPGVTSCRGSSQQLKALFAEDSYELDLLLTALTTLPATTPGEPESRLIGRRPGRPVVNVKHHGHNCSK
jgi:hypothetical protein